MTESNWKKFWKKHGKVFMEYEVWGHWDDFKKEFCVLLREEEKKAEQKALEYDIHKREAVSNNLDDKEIRWWLAKASIELGRRDSFKQIRKTIEEKNEPKKKH